MKITPGFKYITALALAGLLYLPVFAQNLRVAAAANLQSVIAVLQKDFKQKTGIQIEPIVGSSGKLVAQIKNGAPFDVFLSADMSFPNALDKVGLALQAPVIYAYGSLVICSSKNIGFENWQRALLTNRVKKIAIANPSIAPYGVAAQQVLQRKGILGNLQKKLVYGESISQVNTYITTGSVELGFTTQALIKDPANKTKLHWRVIDPKLYSPIEQGMVILKNSPNKEAAQKFFNYLQSAAAKGIFVQYGYKVK
ncbi:molybdate ABC transporter substrate-binding protein [Mucilaginibacter puniceus]